MPLRYVCRGCGFVLYDGTGFSSTSEIGIVITDELIGPENIYKKYNGKCPKCKRKLEFPTFDINIFSSGQKTTSSSRRKRKNI